MNLKGWNVLYNGPVCKSCFPKQNSTLKCCCFFFFVGVFGSNYYQIMSLTFFFDLHVLLEILNYVIGSTCHSVLKLPGLVIARPFK